MPETETHAGEFHEDMHLKAEWFYKTRGHISQEQLNEKWNRAVAQVQVLREARKLDLDPGGGALKTGIAIVSNAKGLRAAAVPNPDPGASRHFATDCYAIQGGPSLNVPLKLKPRRGAGTRLALQTARIFVWDDENRRWRLVEHSGYNRKSNYLWAIAHRGGIYAAIALPKDTKQVQKLCLLRYAHHNLRRGMELGHYARVADYFDKDRFKSLLVEEHELTPRKAAKVPLKDHLAIHAKTAVLKKEWPRRLPPGGLPEWDILEDLRRFRPEYLDTRWIDLLRESSRFVNDIGHWYSYGPANINGRIKSLAIHPSQGNLLYAGAANGGIWKTEDGGGSWSPLWKFEDTMAIGSVAIAPSAPVTLYAATGEDTPGWGPSYGGTGVYKSTNAGRSWVRMVDSSRVGGRCSRIVVHPSNPDIVYLASERGVYKTTDGGDHWDLILSGHATDLVIAHDEPGRLYAGLWNNGVHKTADGGHTWTRIGGTIVSPKGNPSRPFPTGDNAGWIKLAIGRAGASGSKFLLAKLGKDSSRVLGTRDGGSIWFPVASAEGASYDEWTSLVAVHPNDEGRRWVGGVGLQYQVKGDDFRPASGTHSDHHVMVFDPKDPRICYVATDGGVYKSADEGRTFRLASTHLIATQLVSLGISSKGPFLMGGATQDQGIIQTEGAMHWNDFGGGNEWGIFVVDPNDSRNVYISPGSGQLRRSRDSGRHYTSLSQGLTDYWEEQGRQTRVAAFRHVAVQPGNSQVLIGACTLSDELKDADDKVIAQYPRRERIYYSSDQGENWSIALTLTQEPSYVAFAPSNGMRAYAATRGGELYRSDQGGQSGWRLPYTSTQRPPAGSILSIHVDREDPDRVYITYGDHNPPVYRSTDGGQTWVPVSGARPDVALPDIAVSALEVDLDDRDTLYAGTDVGVFRSTDGGNTWSPFIDSFGEEDLPRAVVTGMKIYSTSNRLFVATMGRGAYYTYTSNSHRLQVLGTRRKYGGKADAGIQFLRVTDGEETFTLSRRELITRIETGTYVYTVGSDGHRAEVLIARDSASEPAYLTTKTDRYRSNNLLSLPEF